MKRRSVVLQAAGLFFLFIPTTDAQTPCQADYDGNGATDSVDVELFQAALGSQVGEENYLPQADHDGDGRITTLDYATLIYCAQNGEG